MSTSEPATLLLVQVLAESAEEEGGFLVTPEEEKEEGEGEGGGGEAGGEVTNEDSLQHHERAPGSLSFGPWPQPHLQQDITNKATRKHKQHAENFAHILLVMVSFAGDGLKREVNACMGTCVTLWGNWHCRLRLWRKLIDMPFGERGDTRLILAARHARGHLYMPRILAAGKNEVMGENGAKVDERNEQYETAFFVACKHGHFESMQILLDAGADIEALDSEGMTPLIAAGPRWDIAVAEWLLKKGANMEAIDFEGNCPSAVEAARHTQYQNAKRDGGDANFRAWFLGKGDEWDQERAEQLSTVAAELAQTRAKMEIEAMPKINFSYGLSKKVKQIFPYMKLTKQASELLDGWINTLCQCLVEDSCIAYKMSNRSKNVDAADDAHEVEAKMNSESFSYIEKKNFRDATRRLFTSGTTQLRLHTLCEGEKAARKFRDSNYRCYFDDEDLVCFIDDSDDAGDGRNDHKVRGRTPRVIDFNEQGFNFHVEFDYIKKGTSGLVFPVGPVGRALMKCCTVVAEHIKGDSVSFCVGALEHIATEVIVSAWKCTLDSLIDEEEEQAAFAKKKEEEFWNAPYDPAKHQAKEEKREARCKRHDWRYCYDDSEYDTDWEQDEEMRRHEAHYVMIEASALEDAVKNDEELSCLFARLGIVLS